MQEKAKIRAKFTVISTKNGDFWEQQRHSAHLEWVENSSGGRGTERACGGRGRINRAALGQCADTMPLLNRRIAAQPG